MTLRSLLIYVGISIGSTFAGMGFALVLHLAGMPAPLIVVTVALVSSVAVLLDWRHSLRARDEDEEAAA